MQLILATHNKYKITEISQVLDGLGIEIKSLLDYPEVVLPPETGSTFLENAAAKARAVYKYLVNSPPLPSGERVRVRGGRRPIAPLPHRSVCILSDDSGLVVDALDGRPGIYSSRYSGEPVDYARNNQKILDELRGVSRERRTAHFICSMVLIDPTGCEHLLEGRVDGVIAEGPRGEGGFGYDPIFYLPDRRCTVAEIPMGEKNKISHRGLAAAKMRRLLLEFLNDRR